MSVDLTDPHIASAYEDILQSRSKDWLLLTYGQTRDKLSLYASGEGGVDALRGSIPDDLADVYFGFVREEENRKNYYALIAYVPESVSGVRRARALVHSRAVGSMLKAHQATLNTNKLEDVNSENVRERLHIGPSYIPRANTNGRIQRSASEPSDHKVAAHAPDIDVNKTPKPRLRSPGPASEIRGPTHSLSATKTISRIVSQPQPIRRLQESDDEAPPPTPPKDRFTVASSRISGSSSGRSSDESGRASGTEGRQHARPLVSHRSELAYASGDVQEDDKVAVKPSRAQSPNQSATRARSASQASSRPSPRPLSPAERARFRMEAHKQREMEEQRAIQEETERQARLKLQKEETLRRAMEEDEQRRINVEEEKRRAIAERARRERERVLAEERWERELEAKKHADRERRMLEAKRLDEARSQERRRAEEEASRREEQRRTEEGERREKMKEIQNRFQTKGGVDPVLLSGSITVQTSTSITWRRRFFELNGSALLFYKDSLDRAQPLDIMDLTGGRVRAIREPRDGFEELEAISHSFAVEFQDGDGPWSMFADSGEDKDILVSLLSQAAGL